MQEPVFRHLKPDEISAHTQLMQNCFSEIHDPDPEPDDRPEGLAPDLFCQCVTGGFVGDDLVTAAAAIPFRQKVRDRLLSMAGVAGVATYPEYRARGWVRLLFAAMLRDARENGCAVSMLAPFKPSFYERLGYVAVNGSQTVTFNPEALAAYRHRAQPDHTLERCLGDPGRQRMFTLVETHPEWLHHGQVWFDSVRHPRFERRFRNSCSVFVQDQGRDIGVLTYLKNGDCLEVLLLGAESRSALVALLGYLAAHRDQVPNLRFHLPPGTRFWEWIGDTRHLEVRQNANPWQVRILDTVTALQGHSCSRPGCLVVEIEDELCPWTAGRYRLEVCDARLSVTPCGPGTEVVDARADQRALAALLYGAASCETLTWREWLSVSKPDTGVLLDTWFPVQTMDSMVHF